MLTRRLSEWKVFCVALVWFRRFGYVGFRLGIVHCVLLVGFQAL